MFEISWFGATLAMNTFRGHNDMSTYTVRRGIRSSFPARLRRPSGANHP